MKHLLFPVFLFFSCSLLSGQNQDFSTGISLNHYYNYRKEARVFDADYQTGFSLSWGIEKISIKGLPIRVALKMDNYKGHVYIFNGGLGGGVTLDATIAKYAIALGIYPLNLKVVKNLNINIGGEVGALIHEKEKGSKSYWQSGVPGYYQVLGKGSNKVSSNFSFGITGRIAYCIPLKNHLYIIPQYLYYLGLSDELKDFQSQTSSIRHYLAIGIGKSLEAKPEKLK